MLTSVKWVSSGLTDTGNVRKKNEDALLVNDNEQFWLVADGMGGHSSGEIASQLIVKDLLDFTSTKLLGQNVRKIIHRLKQINHDLEEYARTHDLGLVGSTVAVLHINKNVCACIWAGDSRVYRLRDQKLKQLTTDHCQATELLEMEFDAVNIDSMPGMSAITRAIGSDEILAPQVNIFDLHKDDKFILCTDGLNKELLDEQIAMIVADNPAHKASKILLQSALEVRGRDNISIIVVEQGE